MIDNFVKELKTVKKGQTILCQPIEEFAFKLENLIDTGRISDAETLSSKIAEALNIKHKLLQDSIDSVEVYANVKRLIISGILNAEDIIMLQEKYN
uniref:Uncharacterized protein n=1 Tax=Panagrolaimus sp. PS1159 TaxID=55785 RepID=A0AC35FE65_9BILA